MAFLVDQLFAAQTKDQIRAQLVVNLLALDIPADKWRSGGVASTILTVVAIAIAMFSSLIATLVKGQFVATATGANLRALAFYAYGIDVDALTATFAKGFVDLTNTGGGIYTLAAGQLVMLNSTTGKQYTNDADIVIPALDTLSAVAITCTEAGTVGNANPSEIDALVTTLLGVTVTNTASVAGSDAISDEALRQLCLDALGARSVRGPRTAYAYAIQIATNVVTGALVNINRWAISASSHTGTVTIYLASPSGVPDANDVLGVIASIEANARPDAVTVNTAPCTVISYTATITPYVIAPSGVTAAQLTTAAGDAVTAYFETYAIGGEIAGDDDNPTFQGVLRAGVYSAIGQGVATVGGKLVSASGGIDLALVAGQVAQDVVTINMRVLPPPSSTSNV